MNSIYTVAIIAVMLVTGGFKSKGVWIIDAESQLTIEGSTNINKFICKTEYCTGTDTLRYVESNSALELRFTRSRMRVPIRSFDCGARQISRDFWKTLKSETHPDLEIDFISLENLSFADESTTKGIVDITLAGSTTRYTVCYKVSVKPNGNVHLKGVRAVKFSDFKLIAPEKLKGLIKVNEGLTVDFSLVLKEI
ncbi:MAG: hypothetical protein M3Y60_10025 [Bacteroidota bacterium]|nr:hypothetical protein [Bacteroidota bacterium]